MLSVRTYFGQFKTWGKSVALLDSIFRICTPYWLQNQRKKVENYESRGQNSGFRTKEVHPENVSGETCVKGGSVFCWAARPLIQIESDGVPTTRKKMIKISCVVQKLLIYAKKKGQSPHSAMVSHKDLLYR